MDHSFSCGFVLGLLVVMVYAWPFISMWLGRRKREYLESLKEDQEDE